MKKNKRIDEIKYGVLSVATQLGIEHTLRPLFDLFALHAPNSNGMSEKEIRTILFKLAVQKGCGEELKVAFGFYDQLPKRRETEAETRANILAKAALLGVPKQEVISVFNEFDNLLKTATNEAQRQQIANMGAAKLHKLLMVRGPLVMDGVEVIPAMPDFDEAELNKSKFEKVD